MRCAYTNFAITRRFGVPQGYKPDEPLQLIGTYGSIGILIRHLCSKLAPNNHDDNRDFVIGQLSRIGTLIGRPLTLSRNEQNEFVYIKEELNRLTELAAPVASLLDFNGGTMSFSEYIKKDKTWNKPEFNQYGQTEEEVKAQKEKTNSKKATKRAARVGKPEDEYRMFYFGQSLDSKNQNITRVSLKSLLDSGFFDKDKNVRHFETGKGMKIAYNGGSTHNKEATKKFYGKQWKEFPVLKGDVVIELHGEAPLDMDEYMEIDDEFLARYRADKGLPSVVVTDPLHNLTNALSNPSPKRTKTTKDATSSK
jgi:hypothetical protein